MSIVWQMSLIDTLQIEYQRLNSLDKSYTLTTDVTALINTLETESLLS